MNEFINVANINKPKQKSSFKFNIFFANDVTIRNLAYIPFALGLSLGDAFHLRFSYALFLAKFINGLCCVFLYYFSMRKLKFGKLIVAAFATLPYIFTGQCQFSYTPWVIAWITYASACIISLLQTDESITMKDLLPIYICFLIGELTKPPYLLTVLLGVILPRNKFDSKRTYKANILFMIFTILILLASLIIPIFFDSRGIDMYSDKRGGTNVDAFRQFLFIIQHPVIYVKVLIKNLYTLLKPNSFIFGKLGFNGIGVWMGGMHYSIMPFVTTIFFFFTVITEKKGNCNCVLYIPWRRIFVFLLTLVNICVIATVLYMNYTEVGENIMKGINPLYFMTMMFPFFYFCSFEKVILINTSFRKYNFYIFGTLISIMFLTLFKEVVRAWI